MATYRVQPLPDGTSLRGNWQLKKSGKRVSKHLKQSAAIDKAYRKASEGDTLIIHKTDGEVRDERTVQG